LEAARFDQLQLLANPRAGGAGQLGGVLLLPGGEEQTVVLAEAELVVDLLHVLGAVVLGDRTTELALLARDVAESGEALSPRPLVHVVEELAALLVRGGRRNRANHASRSDDLLEQTEA